MYLRGDISILVPAVFSEIVAILTAPVVVTVAEPLHLKYGNGLQITRYIFSSKELLQHYWSIKK